MRDAEGREGRKCTHVESVTLALSNNRIVDMRPPDAPAVCSAAKQVGPKKISVSASATRRHQADPATPVQFLSRSQKGLLCCCCRYHSTPRLSCEPLLWTPHEAAFGKVCAACVCVCVRRKPVFSRTLSELCQLQSHLTLSPRLLRGSVSVQS